MPRRLMRRLSCALLMGAAVALAEAADSGLGPSKDGFERQRRGDYIDVTMRGTLKAGVMAIGAETTGVTLTAGTVTWELDLDDRQREIAGRLDGRRAIVSGELRNTRGVEVRSRYIVKVRSIKKAP